MAPGRDAGWRRLARRRESWRRPERRIRTASGPPARATARTTAPLRACHLARPASRGAVVDVRDRALDPCVAALEELMLPHRRDLLDPLDDVPAGLKRLRAMR